MFKKGQNPQNVPPAPNTNVSGNSMLSLDGIQVDNLKYSKDDRPVIQSVKLMDACPDDLVFSRVNISGNYGANFCGEYQSQDYFGITLVQARGIAWTNHGLCSHTISCYDSDGNLVEVEH